MAGTSPGTNTSIMSQLAQLMGNVSTLVERMESVIGRLTKLETMLEQSERNRNEFRNQYERSHATLKAEVDAAHRRIDEHERHTAEKVEEFDAASKELDTLKDAVLELKHSNRLIASIGGIVGSAVILWFVGRLLGLL